jgi:signal transduction histidine kinase
VSLSWLLIISALFLVTVVLLVFTYLKLRKQQFLVRLQSKEIEKQIRELLEQNQVQESLNREKKQLILLVSHDLKGPFNRIFALMQLLEMSTGNLNDEQKEYLGKVYQIVGDGMNMVRNLVDVRKIEERGLEPSPESINLPSMLFSIVKQYRVTAEKKHIKINFQSPDKLQLMTDKLYVSRIIENLLSNAIKFSDSNKEVDVTIIEQGSHACVAIRDNGPGLSDEDQQKLYQKFQKLTPRPTGGESSTGLGLSIVKQLVNSIGGDVECVSKIDQGSVFTIRLPLQQAAN